MATPDPVTYPAGFLAVSGAAGYFSGSPIAVGDTVVLNAVDADGVYWIVNQDDGLKGWGSPPSTLELEQRARDHGATESEAFMTHRTIVVEGVVDAPSAGLASAAMNRLIAAVSLQPFVFAVSEAGYVRHVVARRQDEIMTPYIDDKAFYFSFQVVAADPRKFGPVITSGEVNMALSVGGITAPMTAPLTVSATNVAGIAVVVNEGNTNAPGWIRINGPITGGFGAKHAGQDRTIMFSDQLELEAGQWMEIDLERRTVKLQGQASRSGFLTTREWFTLNPGSNEIAFLAGDYNETATLSVTTKSAWE